MGTKIKTLIQGEEVWGEEVGCKPKKEEWNVYQLEDGTVLKTKNIVTKVIRTKKKHPTSNYPIYSVSSQNIVEVTVPEKLQIKNKDNKK